MFQQDKQNELPVKRPVLRDFNIQANFTTTRETMLVKKNRILQQQVKRQGIK